MLPGLLHEPALERIVIPRDSLAATWPTLCVLDSDTSLVRTLVHHFEKRGFHVAGASSVAEAKDIFLRRKAWTLVIAEYHLPDGTGWEFCCWAREVAPATPFVITSANPRCALMCEGTEFLLKPLDLEALAQRVHAVRGA